MPQLLSSVSGPTLPLEAFIPVLHVVTASFSCAAVKSGLVLVHAHHNVSHHVGHDCRTALIRFSLFAEPHQILLCLQALTNWSDAFD